MLSTSVRLRLQEIANKMTTGQAVSLEERIWASKWAKANRSASSIISKAQRIQRQGKAHEDSLDGFLQALDLGEIEPSQHLIGPQDPVELAEWLKPNENDHMTRD